MPGPTERINNIYKKYYHAEARDRAQRMALHAEYFCEEFFSECDCINWIVNTYIINCLVESYFLDVIRYKDYHFVYNSNMKEEEAEKFVHKERNISPGKVAAYTLKWILKYMPIVCYFAKDNISSRCKRKMVSANFVFALDFSLGLIRIDPRDLPQETRMNLLYHARFRTIHERDMFLVFDELHKNFSK